MFLRIKKSYLFFALFSLFLCNNTKNDASIEVSFKFVLYYYINLCLKTLLISNNCKIFLHN